MNSTPARDASEILGAFHLAWFGALAGIGLAASGESFAWQAVEQPLWRSVKLD